MGNFEGALRSFTCNHSHYTASTDEKFKVHYIGPFQKAQDASISIVQESAEEPANFIFPLIIKSLVSNIASETL